MTQKTQVLKDKLDLIKITNFCASKDIIKKTKQQQQNPNTYHQMGENICQLYIW